MGDWKLTISIFQLTIGLSAILAYIILAVGGRLLGKWTITLALAIAFVVVDIFGIIERKRVA